MTKSDDPEGTGQGYRYRLKFVPPALDEWRRLDGSVKEPLRRLLRKRLVNPHLPGAELHGSLAGCYKIKLRKQGYRLIYTVEDDALIVLVLAVDRREDSVAYRSALDRLRDELQPASVHVLGNKEVP